MSLRQRVKLELEDGREIEVGYSAIDLRAWETRYKKSALVEDMSVTMLSWLGWHAAVRQELVNGELSTWEKFDAACASVEGLRDKEETEVPTKAQKPRTPKKAGAGSSAP